VLQGRTVVDSTRAVLVWEPRRFVPAYAVPADDIQAELVGEDAVAGQVPAETGVRMGELSDARLLGPGVGFAAHTVPGRAAGLRVGEVHRPAAAFHLDDPAHSGYVLLDFNAFDARYEEDELNLAHPRDPYKRIDVLSSSRHVRLELDGQLLAESSRPMLLFETLLPTRYYLPREDVRAELVPSDTVTLCAYKGRASYWSVRTGGRSVADLAWTYEEPLHDAERVRGLVAFFNERVDVILDGERQERPVSPWS
jgi:uncharacterized protein (DUF427 family)